MDVKLRFLSPGDPAYFLCPILVPQVPCWSKVHHCQDGGNGGMNLCPAFVSYQGVSCVGWHTILQKRSPNYKGNHFEFLTRWMTLPFLQWNPMSPENQSWFHYPRHLQVESHSKCLCLPVSPKDNCRNAIQLQVIGYIWFGHAADRQWSGATWCLGMGWQVKKMEQYHSVCSTSLLCHAHLSLLSLSNPGSICVGNFSGSLLQV